MDQLNVPPPSWSAGTGAIGSVNELTDSIRSAQGQDIAVTAASVGLNTVVAVVGVVSLALDPMSKLIAIGLGWMIEHIGFLRKPLDLLAGNPPVIAAMSDQLHRYGEKLRLASTEFDDKVKEALDHWDGEASAEFTVAAADIRARLDTASKTLDTAGYVLHTCMALITALRDMIRDMITSVLGDIISTIIVAMATAALTFGVSLVVGVAKCIVVAIKTVVEMTIKVAKVLKLARRSADRIDDLISIMGQTLRPMAPHAKRLPTLPAPAPVRPTVEPSPFARYDATFLNRHRGWLDRHGFKEAQARTRFADNWMKIHFPAAYPYVKAVGDLGSSKNYAGLGFKATTITARELLDIHRSAEEAWRRENEGRSTVDT